MAEVRWLLDDGRNIRADDCFHALQGILPREARRPILHPELDDADATQHQENECRIAEVLPISRNGTEAERDDSDDGDEEESDHGIGDGTP